MLEDLDEKLTSDLTIERKTRENTEETLLRLLEETCMRIESSAFNWYIEINYIKLKSKTNGIKVLLELLNKKYPFH